MAVKLAAAMGAEVAVFTSSERKVADAKALGATQAVVSTNPQHMSQQAGRFDFILDTVSSPHEIDGYISCLKPDATLCLLGIDPAPLSFSPVPMVFGQKQIAASLIGGLQETQQMIDFCFKHDIVADIELLPVQKINAAFERLRRNDVKYRFVVDMATL
jgi:uncharacterized zinc-type alcohol dehydrogenase-like protein